MALPSLLGMQFAVVSDKEAHFVDSNGKILRSTVLPHVPHSVAVLGETVVFTHATNPSILQVGERLIDLPSVSYALTAFNHTIYAVCDMCLVAVDPLCWAVVTIPTSVQLEEIRGRGMWMVGRATNKVFYAVRLDSFTTRCLEVVGDFAPTGPVIHSNAGVWLEINVEGNLIPCDEYHGLPIGGGCFARVRDNAAVVSSQYAQDVPVVEGPNLLIVPTAENDGTCMVCLDDNEEGESVTLPCGHAFHMDCLQSWMGGAEKYISSGDHITFNGAMCPAGCGALVRHTLAPRSEVIAGRMRAIESKALAIQKFKGYESKTSSDLLFYHCSRCEQPFYGGDRVCPRMTPNEPVKDPSELVCDDCNPMRCAVHGSDLLVRKCRFCDKPASDRSFGCIYHCEECGTAWADATVPAVAESTKEYASRFYVLYCAGCSV